MCINNMQVDVWNLSGTGEVRKEIADRWVVTLTMRDVTCV